MHGLYHHGCVSFFSGMGPRSRSFQRLTSHLIAFHYPRHRNLMQFGFCWCRRTASLRSCRFFGHESQNEWRSRGEMGRGPRETVLRGEAARWRGFAATVAVLSPFHPQLHHSFWPGFPAHQNRQLRRLENGWIRFHPNVHKTSWSLPPNLDWSSLTTLSILV